MANIAEILNELTQERDRIDAAIAALVSLEGFSLRPKRSGAISVSSQPGGRKKRFVSPEARAKMAAAQKARRERERKARS